MGTNYERGYNAENKCVNELKEKGYIAFRSAGSHSPADVVAIDQLGIVTFIQVKTVQNETSVQAARKIATKEIKQMPNFFCHREVWVKIYGRKGWAIKEEV